MSDHVRTSLDAYASAYARSCAGGKSPRDAALGIVEHYLDGWPSGGKKKVSQADRDQAFWSSDFLMELPSEVWSTEPCTLALVRYFLQARTANSSLLCRIARAAPETLCFAVRRSGLVLRPGSSRYAELTALGKDVPEVAQLCGVLELFQVAYRERLEALEASRDCIASLSPFEILIYSSLHAFRFLVPAQMGRASPGGEDERLPDQVYWDALNHLLAWKLATAPESALRLTQEDIARSIRDHLSPLLFPPLSSGVATGGYSGEFAQAIADQVEFDEFVSRSAEVFCYDDSVRFVRRAESLEIEVVDPAVRTAWDRGSQKLDRLHEYWLHRAFDLCASEDVAPATIGKSENHDANRIAWVRALRTQLRLIEVYGLEETVSVGSGQRIPLFTTLLSLELMSAFFGKEFLLPFLNHLSESDDPLEALSRLAFQGLRDGFQLRFPVTWSNRAEKVEKIVGWTVNGDLPMGCPRIAAGVLDFWTSDWAELGKRLRTGASGLMPELLERPVLRLGDVFVQLPWMVGTQNNSTAAINNLRRIGARRRDARDETRRIEGRLSRLFESRGFRTIVNWEPGAGGPDNPGEVDLICVRDEIVMVCELKSTYLRRSQRDAWLHLSSTLRKAGKQVARKVAAVERALKQSAEFAGTLGLTVGGPQPKLSGWIVDTSIEGDHQRFEGFLKVSLEEVIIALRDDVHLLQPPPQVCATLYPSGFSASRFVEVLESEEVWSGLASMGLPGA